MKEENNKGFVLTIVMIAMLLFVMAGIAMRFLPDTVPMHFGADGMVDRYGSKYEMFIVAAVMCLGPAFALVFPKMKSVAPSEDDDEKTAMAKYNNRKVMRAIGICEALVFDVIFLVMLIVIGTRASDEVMDEKQVGDILVSASTIGLSIFFVIIGNVIPKTKRNGMVGVRTVWSEYNDVTWARSNRFGGISMMAAGVVSIILTAFIQGMASMIVMLVLILAASGLMIWYSYRVYKEEKAKEKQ